MAGKTVKQVSIKRESRTYPLKEVCERCGVHAEFIIKLVEYGVIEPTRKTPPNQWSFDAASLARLRRAQRLERDLRLNLPGVAMSLDLLDEIDRLEQQVDSLRRRLDQFVD